MTKTILVTGATNGIGLEASVAMAKAGHRLVLVGRDSTKAEAAVADVKARSGSSQVEALACDFASQASIRRLAQDVLARYPRLDVLVNNAGTVNPKRTVTADGIEATFAVNHLGYFLLTRLLTDLMVKSAPSRIVLVASVGHYQGTMDLDDVGFEKGGYGIMKAYQRSKLGNVLFTRALAKRLQGKGVTVNALHPGGVATGIWNKAPGWAQPFIALARPLFFITPEEGGKTIVYLATSPEVQSTTGLYFEKNRAKEPARLALDEALGERLWALSDKLTGLTTA